MVTVEGLEAALPRCSLKTAQVENIHLGNSGNPLPCSQVNNFERVPFVKQKQTRLSETYQPAICNIAYLSTSPPGST